MSKKIKHKVQINNLPDGVEIVNGEVKMAHGGPVTGDQADYGLTTFSDHSQGMGSPDSTDVRYSLSSVPREKSNLEAEGGETVLTDLSNDGNFGLYDIKGPRHSSGGVPMFLPEQSFIFSDTNKMKLDRNTLKEFDIDSRKKMTPAKVSKKYDLNKYYGLMNDDYVDKIQASSAELMLKKNMESLSKLSFVQEAKKGFEEGVPLAAHPYLESIGEDPIQFTAKIEEISEKQAAERAIAALPPEQQEQIMMMQQLMQQAEQQAQQQQQAPGMEGMPMDPAQMQAADPMAQMPQGMMPPPEQGMMPPEQGMPMMQPGGEFWSMINAMDLSTAPTQEYFEELQKPMDYASSRNIVADAQLQKENPTLGPTPYEQKMSDLAGGVVNTGASGITDDPTVEKDKGSIGDRIERGYNQFIDSPLAEKIGKTSDAIVKGAGLAKERIKTKRGRQANQDLLKMGMADNMGMNFDPMMSQGTYDVNTGLAGDIIAGDGSGASGFDSYRSKFGREIAQDGMEFDFNKLNSTDDVDYLRKFLADDGDHDDDGFPNSEDPQWQSWYSENDLGNTFDTLREKVPVAEINTDNIPEGQKEEEETTVVIKTDDGKKKTVKAKRVVIYDDSRQKIATIYKDSDGNMIHGDLVSEDLGTTRLAVQPSVKNADGDVVYYGDLNLLDPDKQQDFETRFPWATKLDGYKYGQGKWVKEFQQEYEKRAYEYAMANQGEAYFPYFKGKGSTPKAREAYFRKKNPWAKDITFPEGTFDNKYRSGESTDGDFGGHTYSAPLFEEPEKETPDPTPTPTKTPTPIKEIDVPEISTPYVKPKADWWTQDMLKLNSIGNRQRDMFMPWQPAVQKTNYDFVLEDPTRAIAAINEQLGVSQQAIGAFAGPQSMAARNAQAQGRAALEIANEIGRANQRNTGTINRGLAIQAQYDQMANQEQDRRRVKEYDDTQKVLQTYMDEKNFDREQYADALGSAITNRANTFNLNSIQDYYNIDPTSGGMVFQTNSKALNPVDQPGEYDFMNRYTELATRWKLATGEDPSAKVMEGLMAQHARNQAGMQPQESYMQREMRSNPSGMTGQYRNGKTGGEKIKPYAVPFYTGKMGY